MNCEHCNKPLEARRSTKKYCSNTCRQYAYQKRRAVLMESDVSTETNTDPTEQVIFSQQNESGENKSLALIQGSKRSQESGYEYFWPEIFTKIEDECCKRSFQGELYFKPTDNGGKLSAVNISDFSYLCPRIMCVIENLFFLSYKKRVHYNTIHVLFLALQEMLVSDHLKLMPEPFPFFSDLWKLYKQIESLDAMLKDNKEGIKFTLDKNTITRFIYILGILREVTERKSFKSLFPSLFNANTS
ncbi:MAG: hypothetical protein ACHQRM_15350 [Bacteroidia bacterium]